jgi:tRNA (cytidine/uridine-2'-O-)-methyltransferase
MQVVLVEPEIPPNTGSVARLCAANEVALHLVGRLGFTIDDRHLRRAGLDYWPFVDLHRHESWAEFKHRLDHEQGPFASRARRRLLGFSVRAERLYTEICFDRGDVLVFGGETRGLPAAVRADLAPHLYRIPITSPHVRSLNLANAVAIVLYEGLRQLTPLRQ